MYQRWLSATLVLLCARTPLAETPFLVGGFDGVYTIKTEYHQDGAATPYRPLDRVVIMRLGPQFRIYFSAYRSDIPESLFHYRSVEALLETGLFRNKKVEWPDDIPPEFIPPEEFDPPFELQVDRETKAIRGWVYDSEQTGYYTFVGQRQSPANEIKSSLALLGTDWETLHSSPEVSTNEEIEGVYEGYFGEYKGRLVVRRDRSDVLGATWKTESGIRLIFNSLPRSKNPGESAYLEFRHESYRNPAESLKLGLHARRVDGKGIVLGGHIFSGTGRNTGMALQRVGNVENPPAFQPNKP